MIQFGMRAHDACRPAPMTEALDAVKAQGLEHLQLAFEKSFSDYDFTTGHYSAGFAHKIGRELAKRDLHVAVLGCYINPVHPDDAARAAEVARFVERLRYAKHCGADMVGTETGRFSPDMSVTDATYGPECYSTLLDSFSTIVDAAERLGVTVGGGERVQPHPAHPRNDGPLPQGHRLPGGGGHSGRCQPGGPLGRYGGGAERPHQQSL